MPASRIKIVDRVQAMLTELAAENAYVIAQSIPCDQWCDADGTGSRVKVISQVISSRRIAPDKDFYEVTSAYHSMSYIADDEDRADCNRLFEELHNIVSSSGIVAALNGTSVTTNDGITVDGVVVDSTSDTVQDNAWVMSIVFRIYATVISSS